MPVKRARWLGVAYLIHEGDLQFPAISSWNIERSWILLDFDCIRAWPPDVLQRLRVPEMAIQQAQSHPLEGAPKARRTCSADEAVEFAHLHGTGWQSTPAELRTLGSERILCSLVANC